LKRILLVEPVVGVSCCFGVLVVTPNPNWKGEVSVV